MAGLLDQQHQRRAELERAYRAGTAPVHLIANLLGHPLVELYRRPSRPVGDSPGPARQSPLFIRHGGRDPDPDLSGIARRWRLHLDVTALLLAADFGILEAVGSAFKPLRIPASLVPTLVSLRLQIGHHQPLRLDAQRAVLRLAEERALDVIDVAPSAGADSRLV